MDCDKDNKKILIIDDNEDDYKIISRYISKCYSTKYFSGHNKNLKYISDYKPDCILLDYHMGTSNGISILKELKKKDNLKNIPVIMMTGEENPEIIIKCMRNNADDYLIKGKYTKEHILRTIELSIKKAELENKIEEQQRLILKISQTDELTGVFSRRYLVEKIEEEILRSKRSNTIFSVTILDIDDFKSINDNYGHLTGDTVLKELTSIIRKGIRTTDYVGRYGGDEFIIVLLDLENNKRENIVSNHGKIIDSIRKSINSTSIIPPKEVLNNTTMIINGKEIALSDSDILKKKASVHFSATFGFALYNKKVSTFSDILAIADKALYRAKEKGKNCTACYENNELLFFE